MKQDIFHPDVLVANVLTYTLLETRDIILHSNSERVRSMSMSADSRYDIHERAFFDVHFSQTLVRLSSNVLDC